MQSVLNEESIFDTINSVLKGISKATNTVSNRGKKDGYYLGGSISKYTRNLTMSFPVLVDDTLSIESAQMISKANEKNIASMLELLFASMSINQKNGTSGKDIIKLFHTNIDSMSADEYIDAASTALAKYEGAEYLPSLSDAQLRDIMNEMVMELKKEKKRFPVSSFSEKSLNDYMCRDSYNGTMVYEHKFVTEAKPDVDIYSMDDDQYKRYKDQRDYEYRQSRDKKQDARQREQDARQNRQDLARQRRDSRNDVETYYKNDLSLNQRRILDSDFKKANELQPTMMVVNFNIVQTADDGNMTEVIDRKSFVAAIKCRMVAAGALDIAERLLSTNKTQVNFNNLIRATTGEIKFGKDFILALDQQKLDAMNDVKKGEAAKLWSTLKKRSTKNNVNKIKRSSNDATSITTLVISQDTVNYMISQNNFDISNPKNAKMVMDRYNLLCLVIADEVNEVAKFLYDGNDNYESISYLVLAREAKDKEIRKATDLLYRSGR